MENIKKKRLAKNVVFVRVMLVFLGVLGSLIAWNIITLEATGLVIAVVSSVIVAFLAEKKYSSENGN